MPAFFVIQSELSSLLTLYKVSEEQNIKTASEKQYEKGGAVDVLKFTIGFLIGSLIQARIVMLAESSGFSKLGANLTLIHFITHILAGQVAGYILLVLTRQLKVLQQLNIILIGAIWGTIIWAIVIPLNASQGKVVIPWEAGISTVIFSLFAFITFGVIASFTIKNFGYETNLNKE